MTKVAWLASAFVLMNLALLVSNCILVQALKESGRRSFGDAVATLRQERERLSADLALLVDRLSALGAPSRASSGGSGAAGEVGAAPAAQVVPVVAGRADAQGVPFEKPAMDAIPLMSDAEKAELSRMAAAMPRLPTKLLLQGDAALLLSSPEWNPGGRQLALEEREEIGRLLAEHKYFAKDSHLERYNTMIAPELPRLREAGAYVKYKVGETPPTGEGVKISHAERYSGDKIRMYLFRPEDYPDFYRHLTVAEERAKETYVKIYQLVNGTP